MKNVLTWFVRNDRLVLSERCSKASMRFFKLFLPSKCMTVSKQQETNKKTKEEPKQ